MLVFLSRLNHKLEVPSAVKDLHWQEMHKGWSKMCSWITRQCSSRVLPSMCGCSLICTKEPALHSTGAVTTPAHHRLSQTELPLVLGKYTQTWRIWENTGQAQYSWYFSTIWKAKFYWDWFKNTNFAQALCNSLKGNFTWFGGGRWS